MKKLALLAILLVSCLSLAVTVNAHTPIEIDSDGDGVIDTIIHYGIGPNGILIERLVMVEELVLVLPDDEDTVKLWNCEGFEPTDFAALEDDFFVLVDDGEVECEEFEYDDSWTETVIPLVMPNGNIIYLPIPTPPQP